MFKIRVESIRLCTTLLWSDCYLIVMRLWSGPDRIETEVKNGSQEFCVRHELLIKSVSIVRGAEIHFSTQCPSGLKVLLSNCGHFPLWDRNLSFRQKLQKFSRSPTVLTMGQIQCACRPGRHNGQACEKLRYNTLRRPLHNFYVTGT